jgi:RimJ/RimL family protein N-acetyltransferase
VLRERQSSELIGHAQAGVTSVRADIAWTVGLRWQNCGYASEAARMIVEWLRSLGVPEIRASINPNHLASIKVAERAGLHRTNKFSGQEVVWASSVDALLDA